MTKMAKFVLTLVAFACLAFLSGCGGKMGHDVYTEYYNGTMTFDSVTYMVNIDENLNTESGFIRMVHVDRTDDTDFRRITGHSGNAGDVFDWGRIFYCGPRKPGDKALGCNSVWRTRHGSWKFEPCDADKGKVGPFTNDEIAAATKLLDHAVIKIRTPEHLSEQWAWDPVQERVTKVWPVLREANHY